MFMSCQQDTGHIKFSSNGHATGSLLPLLLAPSAYEIFKTISFWGVFNVVDRLCDVIMVMRSLWIFFLKLNMWHTKWNSVRVNAAQLCSDSRVWLVMVLCTIKMASLYWWYDTLAMDVAKAHPRYILLQSKTGGEFRNFHETKATCRCWTVSFWGVSLLSSCIDWLIIFISTQHTVRWHKYSDILNTFECDIYMCNAIG